MNVLLDTHVLLWWLADDARLPKGHAGANTCFVSEGLTLASVDGKMTLYDVPLMNG